MPALPPAGPKGLSRERLVPPLVPTVNADLSNIGVAARWALTSSTGNVEVLGRPSGPPWAHDSYLVDPASSHMLVSKTKPCMSKYKP